MKNIQPPALPWLALFGLLLGLPVSGAEPERPKVVYIICDDLGYGDVQCLNPENGKIPTPHVDKLASEGMTFTDAHSGSSVCSPTRYGILTGRYSWRTRLQKGVVHALKGEPIESTRQGVIHHSASGHFAYRQGKWKLVLAKGSGGWTSPRENQVPKDAPRAQLYDMEENPGETTNLYLTKPELAERLFVDMRSDVLRGRSTKGPNAKNDVEKIVLWKSESPRQAAKAPKKKRK